MPPQLVVNTEKDFYFLDPKNKTKKKNKKNKNMQIAELWIG